MDQRTFGINEAAAMNVPVMSCPSFSRKAVCLNCSLCESCASKWCSVENPGRLDELVYAQYKVAKGDSLYRPGDPFSGIYIVRAGFFKSSIMLEDGRMQVTGFYMPGETIGIDGIGTERYICDAVALEDSKVCVIPLSRIEAMSTEVHGMQRQFYKVMSREIVRDQGLMFLLGSMKAKERLAAFLLDLSRRFRCGGYSSCEFHLPMTREEIGSYIGLKLETVSRMFSKFQKANLIRVNLKHVRILDAPGLEGILGRTMQLLAGTGLDEVREDDDRMPAMVSGAGAGAGDRAAWGTRAMRG